MRFCFIFFTMQNHFHKKSVCVSFHQKKDSYSNSSLSVLCMIRPTIDFGNITFTAHFCMSQLYTKGKNIPTKGNKISCYWAENLIFIFYPEHIIRSSTFYCVQKQYIV
jgi:hypothetical protein